GFPRFAHSKGVRATVQRRLSRCRLALALCSASADNSLTSVGRREHGGAMAPARIFVAVVYIILGLSFLASTGLLIQEFQGADWPSMVIAHSHLFYFFPVFGLLALCAFYLPSVVFTDLYWRHLSYGVLRFFFGLIVLAGVSWLVAKSLDKPPRAIWEVSPAALSADKGEPAGCGGASGVVCQRAPILAAL